MTNHAQWWYMEELKRKTRMLEADRDRLKQLQETAQQEPVKRFVKRELEFIDIRLNKLKRGLLF